MKKLFLPIINISFLTIALLDVMPYGFYNLLKIVIFTSSLYYIIIFYDFNDSPLMWISLFQSIIYNPLIPIGLGRDVWFFVNIFSIIYFLRIIIYQFKKVGLKPLEERINDESTDKQPDLEINVQIEVEEISEERKNELFEELKSWRLKKARETKRPAYIIFHDSTFNDIIENISYFNTKDELTKINGIGKIKYRMYGEEIWDIISGYIISN